MAVKKTPVFTQGPKVPPKIPPKPPTRTITTAHKSMGGSSPTMQLQLRRRYPGSAAISSSVVACDADIVAAAGLSAIDRTDEFRARPPNMGRKMLRRSGEPTLVQLEDNVTTAASGRDSGATLTDHTDPLLCSSQRNGTSDTERAGSEQPSCAPSTSDLPENDDNKINADTIRNSRDLYRHTNKPQQNEHQQPEQQRHSEQQCQPEQRSAGKDQLIDAHCTTL